MTGPARPGSARTDRAGRGSKADRGQVPPARLGPIASLRLDPAGPDATRLRLGPLGPGWLGSPGSSDGPALT